MRLTAFVAALALTLAPLPTLAQAQTTVTFEAVDSINLGFDLGPDKTVYGIEVTGIVQGETAPRTILFHMSPSYYLYEYIGRACERQALMAMSKPGQYHLQVRTTLVPNELSGCSLRRNQP